MNATETSQEHRDNTAERLRQLATRPVGRLLWEYSLPAVIGMVVMSLYNVIDRIFIGQGVGPAAIVGLTITFPVMNIATALGVLIGAGASSRISILLGAGNKEGAEQTLGNALVLMVTICASYLTMLGVFLDDILRAFGASELSLPYAHDFMAWVLPGMFMINMAFTFNNVMRASGYPRRAMATMLIGAGCNLLLAPVFIFVLGMGIKGAALATDISMTVSAIFVMAHFLRRDSTLRFRGGIYRLHWATVWGIVMIGAAPSVVNAAACFINVIINTSLARLGGDMAIGAAGIFVTFTSLLTVTIVGLCQGLQPVIGYNYGAGHPERLTRAYWLACGVATAVTTVGMCVGLAWPGQIARAFTSDAELISATVHALRHTLLAFWLVGFQVISTTLFQAIGKGGKAVFLGLTRQVLFLIPLMLWLPRMLGVDGIWYSFPVSDVLATLVTAALVMWQLRRLRAPRPALSAPSTLGSPL